MGFNNFTTAGRDGPTSTIIDVDRISAILPKDENGCSVLVDGTWIDVQTSAAAVVAATGR